MDSKTRVERFIEWVKSFFHSEVRHHPPTQKKSPPSDPDESAQQRYQVEDTDGQDVSGSDSLKEAHGQWQELTDQQGRIIDTHTGEDVTPLPDDDGRFVVLDEQNEQLGSYDDLEKAIRLWQEATDKAGKVIDLATREDVTPHDGKPYLTDEQLDAALQLIRGPGRGHSRDWSSYDDLHVDPDIVRLMMPQINRLPLPIFDVANIRGSGKSVPTKTVPIKRRKVTIVPVRKKVEVELPGPKSPSKRIFVPYSTDEREQRPANPSDIPRLRARDLVLPSSIFGPKLVSGELSVDQDVEEIPGTPTVRKRMEWREFEEPKVDEWTEDVEVTEDTRAQKLAIRVDTSGSMRGDRLNLAIALIALLIGKHLDDDSEYSYAQFEIEVGKVIRANSLRDKRELVTFLIDQESSDLGGGTNILPAIQSAADDVRRSARGDEVPEILLVTDGDDTISAFDVYRAIGEDCVLHAVITNEIYGSDDIHEHSSTYRRIWWDGSRVHETDDEGISSLRSSRDWDDGW